MLRAAPAPQLQLQWLACRLKRANKNANLGRASRAARDAVGRRRVTNSHCSRLRLSLCPADVGRAPRVRRPPPPTTTSAVRLRQVKELPLRRRRYASRSVSRPIDWRCALTACVRRRRRRHCTHANGPPQAAVRRPPPPTSLRARTSHATLCVAELVASKSERASKRQRVCACACALQCVFVCVLMQLDERDYDCNCSYTCDQDANLCLCACASSRGQRPVCSRTKAQAHKACERASERS